MYVVHDVYAIYVVYVLYSIRCKVCNVYDTCYKHIYIYISLGGC